MFIVLMGLILDCLAKFGKASWCQLSRLGAETQFARRDYRHRQLAAAMPGKTYANVGGLRLAMQMQLLVSSR
jgi:hypothetical protein